MPDPIDVFAANPVAAASLGDKAVESAIQRRENNCPTCAGTGRIDDVLCPDCGGTGQLPSGADRPPMPLIDKD
jgi:hypothetical protein